MIIHNDIVPIPPDVPVANVYRVEIEDIHDARYEDVAWTHFVPHPFKQYVITQVFDYEGNFLPFPGVGRTWKQINNGVLIPVVNASFYPLMVVMCG